MTKAEPKKLPPPYASHLGYARFIESLRGDGHLPDQIDRGVLRSMSGSAASAMLKTLEALGLIDATGKPTKALRDLLAHSRDSTEFKAQCRVLLQKAYPYLFAGGINLKTATTNQVQNAFREQEVSGSTVSKCIAFFLAAAKEAGIEVSKYVRTPPMADTATRKRAGGPRNPASDGDDDKEEGATLAADVLNDLHPALSGLLRTLPAPGQPMTAKERSRFMKAFEAVLSVAHPDDDDR